MRSASRAHERAAHQSPISKWSSASSQSAAEMFRAPRVRVSVCCRPPVIVRPSLRRPAPHEKGTREPGCGPLGVRDVHLGSRIGWALRGFAAAGRFPARAVAPYVAMIAILLVRPYGLLGAAPAERV